MKLDIVTFEQAKMLREIGFDSPTESWYGDYYDDEDYPCHEFGLCTASIPSFVQNHNDEKFPRYYDEKHDNYWLNVWSAPTLELVAKWLRGKDIHIEISYDQNRKDYDCYFKKGNDEYFIYDNNSQILRFSTYEDSLSFGIDEAIKILTEEQKNQPSLLERLLKEGDEYGPWDFD